MSLVAFLLYLLVFVFLIRKTRFFGVFADPQLRPTFLSWVFLLKALAVPLMYWLYVKLYGGIEAYDSGVFFKDAGDLNKFGREHPIEYLKALFGLQDDRPGSFFFENYIRRSSNWDNGRLRILLYNDNRVIIRVYSLLYFFSFGSYFVLSLFSCFLSFLGIFWITRALRPWFAGKEKWVLLALCFFPALWLHTGALLKEGPSVFVLGALLLNLHNLFTQGFRLKPALAFAAALFLSFFLKSYLLLFAVLCFGLGFFLDSLNLKFKSLVFVFGFALGLLSTELLSRAVYHRSLSEFAAMRQSVFRDVAKGGIFLLDSVKFVRLKFDTSQIERLPGLPLRYRIKNNVPYLYWEHHHQQDTLYCEANRDSTSAYELCYTMGESGSNLKNTRREVGAGAIVQGLYHALAVPLFLNAGSPQQLLASLENTLLLFSLALCGLGLFISKRERLPIVVFLCFALTECVFIAFTSPNTGAIVRYRSPVVIFLVLGAVYYLDELSARFQRMR